MNAAGLYAHRIYRPAHYFDKISLNKNENESALWVCAKAK